MTDGSTFFADTKRLATKGHRTWLIFRDRTGCYQRSLYGADAIKSAMLAVGTAGRFYWIDPSGNSNICRSWNYALHLLKCARSNARYASFTA